jgi:hypothetical protein
LFRGVPLRELARIGERGKIDLLEENGGFGGGLPLEGDGCAQRGVGVRGSGRERDVGDFSAEGEEVGDILLGGAGGDVGNVNGCDSHVCCCGGGSKKGCVRWMKDGEDGSGMCRDFKLGGLVLDFVRR